MLKYIYRDSLVVYPGSILDIDTKTVVNRYPELGHRIQIVIMNLIVGACFSIQACALFIKYVVDLDTSICIIYLGKAG